jgi:hypothetical protein
MSAAANYNRPKPVDPLWYRADCWLIVWCPKCLHQIKERVRDFQTRHLLPGDMRFSHLAQLLKCESCGHKPPVMDVARQ